MKWKKLDTKKFLVNFIIGILTMVALFISILVLRAIPKEVAQIVMRGYVDIFSGKISMDHFIMAIILTIAIFVYISLFVSLFLLVYEKKNFRKKLSDVIQDAYLKVLKNNSNVFYLILTITISIVLIYCGILFLSTAFPNEPLFFSGFESEEGSFLKCKGAYNNIIDNYDNMCNVTLSKNRSIDEVDYGFIQYHINRTWYKENTSKHIPETGKIGFILNFNKKKQPSIFSIAFKDGITETIVINDVGVYTKDEYFEREREKATWFFAVISISIFSVFSAMANLKRILKKDE